MSANRPSLRGVLLRVIPCGFLLGAAMELFMIKVTIGHESFYETAKRLEVERRAVAAEELRAAELKGGQ
jgi:Uncharacterised protein family UPF0640